MFGAFCLRITVRQTVPSALGLTQPSRVMPVERWSDVESLTATELLVPLNDMPPPYLPVRAQVATEIVPFTVVPAAGLEIETVGGVASAAGVADASLEEVPRFP